MLSFQGLGPSIKYERQTVLSANIILPTIPNIDLPNDSSLILSMMPSCWVTYISMDASVVFFIILLGLGAIYADLFFLTQ